MKLVLMPVAGPVLACPAGVPIDLEAVTTFIISRFPRVSEAPADVRLGDFEGTPCLFIRDAYLSYPNLVLTRDGARLRLAVAHGKVRNPFWVNQDSPTAANGVFEAEIRVGDHIQVGLSVFRVEEASPWQRLFQQVFPEVSYTGLLRENDTGYSLHRVRNMAGESLDVECMSFLALAAEPVRVMLERLTALKQRQDEDSALAAITPKVLDVRRHDSAQLRHVLVLRQALDAPTLEHLVLKGNVPLTVPVALRFGLRLAEAVHAFHGFGLHRNLTPSTVYFAEGSDPTQDRLWLGGLMHTKREGAATAAYDSGRMDADAFFRAPEQVLHGEYTEKSELYVMALLVGVALSGQMPYNTNDGHELAQHIQFAQPFVPPSISPKLREVLNRAWAKKPNQRFKMVLDFRKQLAQIAKE